MKKWRVFVISLLIVLLMVGCNKEPAVDAGAIEHQAVKQQVTIGESENEVEDATDNGTTPMEPTENVTENLDVQFANQVYSQKPPFFYDYYEEVDESSYGNYVLALMDRDGHKVWEAKWLNLAMTELSLGWEPVKKGNVIYIGVYGDLYALNAKDGSVIWQAKGTGSTVKPVIIGNQIYMSGYYGPLLSAIDVKSGEVLWRVEDLTEYSGTYKLVQEGDTIQVICESYETGETQEVVLRFDRQGQLLSHSLFTGDYWEPQYWNEIQASSTLEAGTGKYEPENAWDQNFETAWVEGASGYGLTEWLEMKAQAANVIEYVSIANGYQKSEQTYNENGRLLKYRIDFSTGDYFVADAYYVDQMFSEEHIQLVNPIEATSIRLTILDAAPGTTYEDLCITEWMTR